MIEPFKPEDSFKGSHTYGVCKHLHSGERILVIKFAGEITFNHLKYALAGGLTTSNYCGVILDIREADLEIQNKGIIEFSTFIEYTLKPICVLKSSNLKLLMKLKHRDWFEMDNCFYWMPTLPQYFCYSEDEAIEAISDHPFCKDIKDYVKESGLLDLD